MLCHKHQVVPFLTGESVLRKVLRHSFKINVGENTVDKFQRSDLE